MPPNPSPDAPSTGSGAAPLVFAWKPRLRRAGPVVFAALAAVSLHALCFYLFRVSHGVIRSASPPAFNVVVADTESPAGRSLLQRVEDFASVYEKTLQPPPIDLETPLREAGLDRFHSSFSGYPLKLMPFADPAATASESVPHPETDPVLPPPLPSPEPPRAEEDGPRVAAPAPRLSLLGQLAGRAIIAGLPGTPPPPDPAAAGSSAVFDVAVDASGVVRYAFLTEGTDLRLAPIVLGLRLEPLEADGAPPLQWGRIRVSW